MNAQGALGSLQGPDGEQIGQWRAKMITPGGQPDALYALARVQLGRCINV